MGDRMTHVLSTASALTPIAARGSAPSAPSSGGGVLIPAGGGERLEREGFDLLGVPAHRRRLLSEVIEAYRLDARAHQLPLSLAVFSGPAACAQVHGVLTAQFRSTDLVLWACPNHYLVVLSANGPASVGAVRRARGRLLEVLPDQPCWVGIASLDGGGSVAELVGAAARSLHEGARMPDGAGPLEVVGAPALPGSVGLAGASMQGGSGW